MSIYFFAQTGIASVAQTGAHSTDTKNGPEIWRFREHLLPLHTGHKISKKYKQTTQHVNLCLNTSNHNTNNDVLRLLDATHTHQPRATERRTHQRTAEAARRARNERDSKHAATQQPVVLHGSARHTTLLATLAQPGQGLLPVEKVQNVHQDPTHGYRNSPTLLVARPGCNEAYGLWGGMSPPPKPTYFR